MTTIILNRADWVQTALKILPLVPGYAQEMGVEWSGADAQREFDEPDFAALADRFQKLWEDLPDAGFIRFYPFHEICALCSERHALAKDPPVIEADAVELDETAGEGEV